MEIWKQIPGYEQYEASTEGNVRERRTGVYLIHYSRGKGYKIVTMHPSGGNVKKQVLIHRCVAMAHIGEIPEGFVVDHIDRDIANNNIKNLRIVDIRTNCLNSLKSINRKLKVGVYISSIDNGQMYYSSIQNNKVRYRLGNYATEEDAHNAYLSASERIRNGQEPVYYQSAAKIKPREKRVKNYNILFS